MRSLEEIHAEIDKAKQGRASLRLVAPDEQRPITPRGRLIRIFTARTRQPEIISALAGVAFGFWVGNPLFNVFDSSAVIYSGVASIAPEFIWGLMLFLPGLVALRGLLWPSSWSITLRRFGAGGLFSFWSAAFVGACVGPSLWTTAPVAYSVMVGISGWSVAQLD